MMFRKGRPSNKRPVVEPYRRKCATCGKVRLVKHRKQTIPTAASEYKIPTYNKNATHKKRTEVPGVVTEHYCSIECAGDSFVNTYTEDDFLR